MPPERGRSEINNLVYIEVKKIHSALVPKNDPNGDALPTLKTREEKKEFIVPN